MIKYNIGKYTDKENNPHVHIKSNCHQRVSKVGVDIMHMDRQGGRVGGSCVPHRRDDDRLWDLHVPADGPDLHR